jgi:hypothetical protein
MDDDEIYDVLLELGNEITYSLSPTNDGVDGAAADDDDDVMMMIMMMSLMMIMMMVMVMVMNP